jgi:hypothetical protein
MGATTVRKRCAIGLSILTVVEPPHALCALCQVRSYLLLAPDEFSTEAQRADPIPRSRRTKPASPMPDTMVDDLYPLAVNSADIQAECSVRQEAALVPRACGPPDISPYAIADRWLQRVEELFRGSRNAVSTDNLAIPGLSDARGQSSDPRLPPRCARKRSHSMEFIQQKDIPKLLTRKEGPSDLEDSISTDPLEIPLFDVFGAKIMCADILPQPKKKGVAPVFDPTFIGYCPPFKRADIQAESSVRNLAALFASRRTRPRGDSQTQL